MFRVYLVKVYVNSTILAVELVLKNLKHKQNKLKKKKHNQKDIQKNEVV